MDFRKYATSETSDLVGRVVAGASDKVAGDLQALRQAFEMVTGALDAALASQTDTNFQAEVAALAERLAVEAAKQAEAASQQVRQQAQTTIDELRSRLKTQTTEQAAVAASLAEARSQADKLGHDLQAQQKLTGAQEKLAGEARAECARTEDARKKAEAARLEVEGALQNAKGERAAIADELEAAKSEIASVLARVQASQVELDALKRTDAEHERTRAALQADLDRAGAEAATLRQQADSAGKETERIRAEAAQAAQASIQASEQSARAMEEAETSAARVLAEQTGSLRQQAAAFLSTSLDRMLAMFEPAAGGTIDDVFATVVEAVAVQFPRVALFRVQSNHLEGVRQVGFDLRSDISQVLIPRTLDSLITQAVGSARVETRSGTNLADASGMPFGGSPNFALALPLVIDGQPLAVVYADDSDQSQREFAEPELRVKFAQLLQCQALPALARLAVEAKALAELDEYATLLVNELEQTYKTETKGSASGSDADRRTQMKEDIDYARRLYAQRAASDGPRAALLFEQRLFAALDAHRATPFGRDLAALVGARRKGDRSSDAGRRPGEATGTGAP
jgi:hypothetical protein